MTRRAMATVRRHSLEAMLLLVTPALLLLLLGRQGWTPPNTPDSEFYLSLSAFGHQVTDHAAVPAYYWTRLGVLAPLRALSWLVGPDGAYMVWRWLLLMIAVGPVYLVVRARWTRPAAVAASAVVALNTVFLTVTANPYPTGAVVALLVAEAALLVATMAQVSRGAWVVLALSIGLLAGWVSVCNQTAGVYAALVFLPFAIRAVVRHWRRGLVMIGFAVLAGAGSIALFLAAGRILFPGLDWFETTRYYAGALNAAAFHSSSPDWLRASPFLLVPLVAVGALLIWGYATQRDRWPAWTVAIALALPVVYASLNQFVQEGGLLETPVYAAFLWGPALVGLALLVGWLVARESGLTLPWITATAVVIAGFAIGRAVVVPFVVRPDALALALALLLAVGVACRGLPGAPRPILAAVACTGLMAGVQMLQNGTATAGDFISLRIPYVSAFRDTGVAPGYELDLDVERWVLATTTPGAHLLVWAPAPELGGVAAMSLNGPNALSMSRDLPAVQMGWLGGNAPVDVLIMEHAPRTVVRMTARLRAAGAKITSSRCSTWPGTPLTGRVVACIVHVASVR